jgi:hypothetical protein
MPTTPNPEPPEPAWRDSLLDSLIPPLEYGAVAATAAFCLWWNLNLVATWSEWHVILADSFWAPLAWFRIWTNTVPSAALTAAALWFAIAFCARQFLRKDAYAILALGTFFIACLVWAFFFVAINS